jgi:hypothetical protein
LKDHIGKYDPETIITIRLDSVSDFDHLKRIPAFKNMRLPSAHIRTHLTRNYSDAPGLKKIGYTFMKSFAVVYLSKGGKNARPPYSEQMIVCKEGMVSREEALDPDGTMMTVDEILERAKQVRLARPSETKELGFRATAWVGVDGPAIREWATSRY